VRVPIRGGWRRPAPRIRTPRASASRGPGASWPRPGRSGGRAGRGPVRGFATGRTRTNGAWHRRCRSPFARDGTPGRGGSPRAPVPGTLGTRPRRRARRERGGEPARRCASRRRRAAAPPAQLVPIRGAWRRHAPQSGTPRAPCPSKWDTQGHPEDPSEARAQHDRRCPVMDSEAGRCPWPRGAAAVPLEGAWRRACPDPRGMASSCPSDPDTAHVGFARAGRFVAAAGPLGRAGGARTGSWLRDEANASERPCHGPGRPRRNRVGVAGVHPVREETPDDRACARRR
jgi:hypothetical protein